jgi:transposase InsO family protein
MPWKECNQVELRTEFCHLATVEGANMSTLCERFAVSRKTGYKWLARYRAEGEVALIDRSRRPHTLRDPTSAEVEAAVLEVRDAHPAWGGRKIRKVLLRGGLSEAPAASTITAILHRHGRIDAEASLARRAVQRFERAEPNELWQMDFKGEFRIGERGWCYPLTVLDDHSRYAVALEACDNQQTETVQRHLRAAFRRYGLPQAMLSDNGSPWAAPHVRGGLTRLGVWLLDLDVRLLHGRPYHPQTQGKDERFHRTLKLEVLQGRTFSDLAAVGRSFAPWREMYNQHRPHDALGLEVPASRYRVSERSFTDVKRAFEYDTSFEVRTVDCMGRVRYRKVAWYLARALAGRRVGIRANEADGCWDVYYRTFRVARWRAADTTEEDAPLVNTRAGLAASARCARSSSQSI